MERIFVAAYDDTPADIVSDEDVESDGDDPLAFLDDVEDKTWSSSSGDEDSTETHSLSSESSDDSWSISPGHYECTSGANVDSILCGRWIDPNAIQENPLDSHVVDIVALAKFASSLRTLSRDLSSSGRFFSENEYFRLDETLLSEVFVLLVCMSTSGVSGDSSHTPASEFFTGRWLAAAYDLKEHLKSKTFSRETFEKEYDLRWIVN